MKERMESGPSRSKGFRGAVLATVLLSALVQAHAQEEVYLLKHEEVFGPLQRPPVTFPHERHMEVTEDKGCGACHHLYDEKTGRLYYEQGEESPCADCHGLRKTGPSRSLLWAYHGTCTGCHRTLAKGGRQSGPTMCGGCHLRH
jgi:hypothetical protein